MPTDVKVITLNMVGTSLTLLCPPYTIESNSVALMGISGQDATTSQKVDITYDKLGASVDDISVDDSIERSMVSSEPTVLTDADTEWRLSGD